MFQEDVLEQITKGFAADTSDNRVYTVVRAFAETMLAPMMERYSLYPAKGTTVAHYAHNSDQMMLTHLLNGLFPALILVYEAQKRGLQRLSRLEVEMLKVYVLAYVMHDLDKILGDDEQLETLTRHGTVAAREKLLTELEKIGARAFLPTIDEWAGEILWLVVNTQRTRDINLSHNTFVDQKETRITDDVLEACYPTSNHFRGPRIESTLRDLCTYSDLVAFLVKSPEEVLLSDMAHRSNGLLNLLKQLTENGSGGSFTFAYHKLLETRGFLSNQINNAAIRYATGLYGEDQEALIPYLYFPNGVVYLDPVRRPAPTVHRDEVNRVVKDEIGEACRDIVEGGEVGFNHLGLLKYPRYLHDFLSVERFLARFIDKTLTSSKNAAESTLQKMLAMQAEGKIPVSIVFDYTANERISMLGRFLINYSAIIHESVGNAAPQLQAVLEQRLIERLGRQDWDKAQLIPSSGGVDYRFYWLAAQYLQRNPLATYEHESPGANLQEFFQEFIDELIKIAGPVLEKSAKFQGPYLPDLPDYLAKNLTFGFGQDPSNHALPDFAAELAGYSAAKKQRGSSLSCTICNSEYPTKKQEDASVLFQPWVYKNRLSLYKSENAGGICSICSLELMLRQVLLSDKPEGRGRITVTGKSYEDLELKYFFLYPGFFFTNQTYRLAGHIIRKMRNLKLYELYATLREREEVHVADILALSFFHLTRADRKTAEREEKKKEEEDQEKGTMYLLERYEAKQYPGFIFFAKKTFSKKKAGENVKATTASWLEAAWLGLALPLVTGARVVVTETYLPLFNSAADFLETVVLDAPHQSIRHLLPAVSARLRLDELYGHRKDEGDRVGGMLAAFSRAIELHIDTERVGGDLKLERFIRIARELETDQMFVFALLKEQLRRDKIESIPGKKALHYNDIYYQFVRYYHAKKGEEVMMAVATRHKRVTELYLQFYLPFNDKKKWPTSHAIVRPIDIAARCIIKDTLNMSEEEIKLEMVHALRSWLEIVAKKGATGRVITTGKLQERLVWEFVETFYKEVFQGYAEGQRSLLNSRLNRFKGGCEQVFSLRYSSQRKAEEQDSAEDSADVSDSE